MYMSYSTVLLNINIVCIQNKVINVESNVTELPLFAKPVDLMKTLDIVFFIIHSTIIDEITVNQPVFDTLKAAIKLYGLIP